MRPQKLILSAFGPYAEVQELNMDLLGESGLYLITGDTGAGKTTIFDGITYALFGEASGEARTSEMLRSKYAKADTKTYVQLEFVHQKKGYTIKRNPEYMRPAKRGDKLTKELSNAELTYPDGKVVSGVAAVNHAIIELLGYNRKQFAQISMIAQGDFLKVLFADTKERIGIFREIFHTKKYLELQDKVKQKSMALYYEIEDAKKSVKQYLAEVTCEEGSTYREKLTQIQSGTYFYETGELMELLAEIAHEDQQRLDAFTEERRNDKVVLEQLNQQLGIVSHINQLKTDLENAEKAQSQHELQYAKAKEKLLEIPAYEKERDEWILQVEEEEKNLPRYDELEQVRQLYAQISMKEEQQQKEKCKLEDTLSKMSVKQVSIKEIMEKNQQCAELLERSKSAWDALLQEQKQLQGLKKVIENQKQLIRTMVQKQNQYKKEYEAYQKLHEEYEEMEKAFFEEQAGILGSHLEAGKPCPVCGSLEHPQPAAVSCHAPTQEALEKMKHTDVQKRNVCSELSSQAGTIKGQVEQAQIHIREQFHTMIIGESVEGSIEQSKEQAVQSLEEKAVAKTFTEEVVEELTSIIAQVAEKETRLKSAITVAEEKVRNAQRGKEQYDQAKNELPKLELENNELQQKLFLLEKELISNGMKKEQQKKELDTLSIALVYIGKQEARAHIEILKNKKTQREQEIAAIQKVASEEEIAYVSGKNHMIHLKEQLENMLKDMETVPDMHLIMEEKEKLAQREQEREQVQKELELRMGTNSRVSHAIKTANGALSKKEEQYQWVNALSNTANGNVAGKDKIFLETYVQMAFFDRILIRANRRLMKMSSGQYELKRSATASNLRSQTGLELDVVDHYNGTLRSVKSLSGGESFQASLAMALGLSDEIQSQAGGIQIDAMFIDEGFGSLDEEALNQAVDTLLQLSSANRLVGIISHVSELKERISNQIVVKKQKSNGSYAEIVY